MLSITVGNIEIVFVVRRALILIFIIKTVTFNICLPG